MSIAKVLSAVALVSTLALLCSFGDKLAATTEPRTVQQLIDDICSAPGALECDLHKQGIVDIDGVVWPPDLVRIDLSGNKIAQLSQANLDALPKTLKMLRLADNELELLKDVTFPNNIKVLCMEYNNGLKFNNVRLPNNLKYLLLSNSKLMYKSINWESLSKLELLSISNNGILFNDHDVVRLPESLRDLAIDCEALERIIRNERDRGDEEKFNAHHHNLETVIVFGASPSQREDVKGYFSNLPELKIYS